LSALTTVPTSAQCIRLTVTPATGAATVKTFTVTAGSASTNLQVGPLAPGNYTVTGDAFNVACASIGTTVGTWLADSVSVSAKAGVTTNFTLTFRKNSPIAASANFVNNVLGMTTIAGSTYIYTDSGLLESGYATYSQTFIRLSYSAFDSSSVPGNAIAAISGPNSGACAIRVDGTVWCWGYNSYGELGPGIPVGTQGAPTQVTGLSNATQIAGGSNHTCAAAYGSGGGGVYCWGNNWSGQLGNNTTTNSASPVLAISGNFKSVGAGASSTYAVSSDSAIVYAWGNNAYGQLGDGTTTTRLAPVSIGDSPVQTVVGGFDHACSKHVDTTVRCWGNNGWGQLGDGTTTQRLAPSAVPGLSVRQLVAGANHTCAITTGGQTQCWGYNANGEIGDGTNINRLTPTAVSLGAIALGSIALGSSAYSTCGVATTLDVYCWGSNSNGQLGDGTYNDEFLPVKAQLQ
jgi:alpha-tubulin suppressor-like RCC1 family protein